MGIKPHPTEQKLWILDYNLRDEGGKQYRKRKNVYGTFAIAEKEYAKLRESVHKHLLLKHDKKQNNLTMREMADRYLEYQREMKSSSYADSKRHMEYAVEFFKPETFVKNFQSYQIVEYRRWHIERKPNLKPQSINRFVAYLRAAINMAVIEEWGGLQESPIKSYRMVPEKFEPKKPISTDELQLLIDNAYPTLKDIIYFLLYTGCRISEALNIKWDQIDLDQKVLQIVTKDSKRKGRTITKPISDSLSIILRKKWNENRFGRSQYVFPNEKDPSVPIKSVKTAWKSACKRAGLVDITPHMLRHTFASWLRMSNVDIETVSKLVGHTSIEITSRYYSHLDNDYLREKSNIIGEIFPIRKKA